LHHQVQRSARWTDQLETDGSGILVVGVGIAVISKYHKINIEAALGLKPVQGIPFQLGTLSMEAVKGHPHGVDGVNLRVSQDHSTPLNSSHVQQKEFNPFWRDPTHGNLSSQLPKVFNSTGIVGIVSLEVICHLD